MHFLLIDNPTEKIKNVWVGLLEVTHNFILRARVSVGFPSMKIAIWHYYFRKINFIIAEAIFRTDSLFDLLYYTTKCTTEIYYFKFRCFSTFVSEFLQRYKWIMFNSRTSMSDVFQLLLDMNKIFLLRRWLFTTILHNMFIGKQIQPTSNAAQIKVAHAALVTSIGYILKFRDDSIRIENMITHRIKLLRTKHFNIYYGLSRAFLKPYYGKLYKYSFAF